MKYKEFSKKLIGDILGTQISERSEFYRNVISLSEDGKIYINEKLTEFSTIEEAKEFILQDKLEEEIAHEMYEEIPDVMIANIIHEHHDIKVTDTLIESYLELASSKRFTVDPVVTDIRSFNYADSILENKIDYVLNDGSVVAIDENTQKILSNLLDNKYDLIDYMRESKDNFMHVIKELS